MNGLDAPGRKDLETRLPDIAEKFSDYAAVWSDLGREFGYTDVELRANTDFRDYNMFQEISELRTYKSEMETKLEKAKSKRRGKRVATKGSPRKATSSSSKKNKESNTNYDSINERINSGDHEARIELMEDLFGS